MVSKTFNCKQCGSSFSDDDLGKSCFQTGSTFYHRHGFYTRECYYNSKGLSTARVCKCCNKPFELKDPYKSRKFCSNACALNYRRNTLIAGESQNWTKERIQIVKDYYPEGGWKLVNEKMGTNLTRSQIQTKAHKLGIKRKKNWRQNTIEPPHAYSHAEWNILPDEIARRAAEVRKNRGEVVLEEQLS